LIHTNKELELYCKIKNTSCPYQVIGNIGNYKFYYRARHGNCEFKVCDDFGTSTNPAKIQKKEQGYIDITTYTEKNLDFSQLPVSIEKCTKRFLEYQKKKKYMYRNRYVAFVDIIGFKEIIYSSIEKHSILQEVIESLENLQYEFIEHYKTKTQQAFKQIFSGELDSYSDYDKYKTVAHQISDCIIISNLAHKEGSLENIVQKCSLITHMLIERGFLCRGYIQYGKVLHDEKNIIGPAYIDAYLSEGKEKNITIVMSKETYDIHNKYPTINNEERQHFKKSLKKYSSEKYYIDYFNDYMLGNNVHVLYRVHYEKLRNIIINENKVATQDNVKDKYKWMIEEFNRSDIVKDGLLQPII